MEVGYFTMPLHPPGSTRPENRGIPPFLANQPVDHFADHPNHSCFLLFPMHGGLGDAQLFGNVALGHGIFGHFQDLFRQLISWVDYLPIALVPGRRWSTSLQSARRPLR